MWRKSKDQVFSRKKTKTMAQLERKKDLVEARGSKLWRSGWPSICLWWFVTSWQTSASYGYAVQACHAIFFLWESKDCMIRPIYGENVCVRGHLQSGLIYFLWLWDMETVFWWLVVLAATYWYMYCTCIICNCLRNCHVVLHADKHGSILSATSLAL